MKLRDNPCHCGWKFPGFHVCADLSTPEPPPVVEKQKKHSAMGRYAPTGNRKGSKEWKRAISEGQAYRVKKMREASKDRDDEIVRLYKTGLSISKVAETMKLNHLTVRKALHIRRDLGEVEMRLSASEQAKKNAKR